MPLEVGEIGISMHVGDHPGAGSRGADVHDWDESEEAAEQREMLVEECVSRVLAVLRAQQER